MAFSRTHALVMTAPDDPAFENNPSDWNEAHSVSGATVGGIPYCPTATTETTSANLTYTETSGPRLQVGTGTTTSVGMIVGYSGLSGYAGIWNMALASVTYDQMAVIQSTGGHTFLQSKAATDIGIRPGSKLHYFLSTAGAGLQLACGTATTDVQALSATQTWNAAGVAFKAYKQVVTATASAAGSLDMSLERSTGQGTGISMLSELTTIAAAATTDTAIQIPANAIVLGVSVRVTTVIPTAATFTVTGTTSGTAFQTGASVSTAANTTDAGTKNCPYLNATAQTIRITPNLTPADNSGRVRVTIHYIVITPPTS